MSIDTLGSEIYPATSSSFSSGDHDPYTKALLSQTTTVPNTLNTLHLVDTTGQIPTMQLSVNAWLRAADSWERFLLDGMPGPLLDVGCGPGRMVAAAADQGIDAYGVDSHPAAVQLARDSGYQIFAQSVFADFPQQIRGFSSFLVCDENIGIGGDPASLLRRLHNLANKQAQLLVEADTLDIDVQYCAVLQDASGYRSQEFSWARAGITAIKYHAHHTGWTFQELLSTPASLATDPKDAVSVKPRHFLRFLAV